MVRYVMFKLRDNLNFVLYEKDIVLLIGILENEDIIMLYDILLFLKVWIFV